MKKLTERDLYEPVKDCLMKMLKMGHNNGHLEITADGNYSEALKHLIHDDIVFSWLVKAAPDLTGCILKKGVDIRNARGSDVEDFIAGEIKSEKIKLPDIYQAKMYGDLFCAKYTLLISPKNIGEEIRRLHESIYILNRFRGWKVYVGQAFIEPFGDSIIVNDIIWCPETPF